MKKELPTIQELAINEKLLNECNHPNHTTETEREHGMEFSDLLCTKCGQIFHDYD